MVLFNKCCFCISLEHGAIAIAVLEIISVIGRFITGISINIDFRGISHGMELTGYVIAGILIVCVCSVLIYAVLKRNAKLFVPWLIVLALSIVLNILYLLISVISGGNWIAYSTEYKIQQFFAAIWDTYFWLCVHSLWQIVSSEGPHTTRPNQII